MLALFFIPSVPAAEAIDTHLSQAHLPYDEYGTITVRVDNPGSGAINVTHILLRVYEVRSFTNSSVYTDFNVLSTTSRIAPGGSGSYNYMMMSPYGQGKWSCDIVTSLRLDNGTHLSVTSAADLYGDGPLVWPQTMGAPLFFTLMFALVFGIEAVGYYVLRERWKDEIDRMDRMTGERRAAAPGRLRLMPFMWEREGRIYLDVILWLLLAVILSLCLTGIAFHWY
jgi:hypothetical protein